MYDYVLLSTIFLICVALLFDFTNGFHDAANSIATVVATKTLTPIQAVVMAAFFNFIVVFFISLHVAATIGKGIVDPKIVDLYIIFSCLSGAIIWNIITWYMGLPTSSSHALIGGLVGATLTSVGISGIITSGLYKVLVFIVAAPLIGFALGATLNTIIRNMFLSKLDNYDTVYKYLQLFSSACYSMGHGANDAQKTAGIIFLILVSSGYLNSTDQIPMWAVILSFLVLSIGTLFGGWKIVQTLGFKLTQLNTRQGFVAESSGSAMLFTASAFGIPVSTTHVITGSILGVGASEEKPKVKWKKARDIVVAWILTIPCSGIIASGIYYIITHT